MAAGKENLMKIKAFMVSLLLLVPSWVCAAGLTQHQFMSDIAHDLVTTPELLVCLGDNRDDYLVGASFPDCGYAILNAPLSNLAHSPNFINTFVTHIRQTYAPPYTEQYRLISFLMGAASHVADAPPYHAYFIAEVADRDFGGDYNIAHTFCDAGLDFVSIVDFNRWGALPVVWLPMEDIQSVFEMLGSSFSREEIINGNNVISIAALAERLVALFAYLPVRLFMPWGGENYYDYPEGGLFNGGEVSAAYYESVWSALMSRGSVLQDIPLPLASGSTDDRTFSTLVQSSGGRQVFFEFARQCLEEKIVRIEVIEQEDGSVFLGPPRITNPGKFIDLLVK